ncbi:lasso peptide biosynthesis B2 protein [Actinosynnema sp. NPDC059335]|uniref:lasso peptide biosynthesis B2 protein n=1 Tax=Actinosynnema sp. NPDC059335 TaxID=3346804 RepID=UPI00366DC612
MSGVDWELFVADADAAARPPRVPLRHRVHAAARTAWALRTYRRQGWSATQRHLRALRPRPTGFGSLPPDTAVRLAGRHVFWCQLVVRALAPRADCMPRSLALLAYLSTLGLPAELCIGRVIAGVSSADRFHAWTELHGTVLNDYDDVTMGYRVLQRVAVVGHPVRGDGS